MVLSLVIDVARKIVCGIRDCRHRHRRAPVVEGTDTLITEFYDNDDDYILLP